MAIFAARVGAQFFLQYHSIEMLADFELWHSEVVSYRMLLISQLVVLAAMAGAIISLPVIRPRPKLGSTCIRLGWLYVAIMALRLVMGVFGLSSHQWFDGAISTAFHFGLAAFMLVYGSALKGAWAGAVRPKNSALSRDLAYPVLMIGAYAMFTWLRETGSPPLFSSYLSVLIAGFGVLLHETFSPARDDWRPSIGDVIRDGLFLSLVQVALPAVLRAGALALIVTLADTDIAPLASWWPHNVPVLLQVIGMLVIAEFFRYWLHRALHEIIPLWRLHAVHHASDKLYTVNVGRFHPLDKSLQFLGDTLPFLLLGVSPEVFAAYFVLYAVNGFYQHSNADVRLGPLNWVIAGPELHRWHHSAVLSEAQSNYGNNLIIWDAVFGTRFLPNDRKVGRIGIGNMNWPNGFLAQMTAPFTTPTDAPKS